MEVEIEKLDNEGRGICYVDGKITFVFNALPKEAVKIKLIKETKKYNVGKVVSYVKESLKRTAPICPYYAKCGGCDLEHLSYEDTCKFKENTLKEVLEKYAEIKMKVTFIPSPKHFHYRNKLTLKVKDQKLGFYEEESHKLVEIDKCYLAKECINKVLPYLKINNGDITLRANYNDELIIDITTQDKFNSDIDKLTKDNKIVGIILNNKVIYGEDHFIEIVNKRLFQVHSKSFFQVNLDMAGKAVDIIKNEVSKGDKVVDLYCGVGFLGLSIAKEVQEVYGVETIQSAVLDAIFNAKINKIDNAKFLLGKSEEVVNKLPSEIDTIIVDPPREGLKDNVIEYLKSKQAKKIIYMSCNIFTLARDLKKLENNYKVLKVYGLDMFPYTKHIESICVLNLK